MSDAREKGLLAYNAAAGDDSLDRFRDGEWKALF